MPLRLSSQAISKTASLSEINITTNDMLQQFPQPVSAIKDDAAFCGIGIRADDLETVRFSVLLYCYRLVFKRILLVLGGHPKVLSGRNASIGSHSALLTGTLTEFKETLGEKVGGLAGLPR
jgi:hypothetical protein